MDSCRTLELLIVGNEILSGDTHDTNSEKARELLGKIGLYPDRITVLGDNEENLVSFLKDSIGQVRVLVVTGGLGPTPDDITVACLAKALDRRLVPDTDVLAHIQSFFAERGRKMAPANEKQALIPEGASVIPNPTGTAPGIDVVEGKTRIFLLPGVPREMERMFEDYVLDKLEEFSNGERPVEYRLRTTGIGESDLFDKIKDLPFVGNIAFLPTGRGVDIKVPVPIECREKGTGTSLVNNNRIAMVRERIGEYIYTEGQRELEEVVAELLEDRGLTIATAESVSGGALADLLTAIPGSSRYFTMGIIAYSNESKSDLLEVDPKLIASKGAVSPEVAAAMAEGVRKRAGTDIGLSTTGIAGPSGGSPRKPVGLLYTSLSHKNGIITRRFIFGKDRHLNKVRSAQAALNLLRLFLIGSTDIH